MRGKIKPSKPVAFGQMVGGGIFFIIGLTIVIPKMNETGGPIWFGVLWTLAALGGAIFGAANLFSEDGIPTEEFSYGETRDHETIPKTTESRLEELRQLREKELISEEEYEAKRTEIIRKI